MMPYRPSRGDAGRRLDGRICGELTCNRDEASRHGGWPGWRAAVPTCSPEEVALA